MTEGLRGGEVFVMDFDRHAVFGPGGKRLPLTWQGLVAVLRARGDARLKARAAMAASAGVDRREAEREARQLRRSEPRDLWSV